MANKFFSGLFGKKQQDDDQEPGGDQSPPARPVDAPPADKPPADAPLVDAPPAPDPVPTSGSDSGPAPDPGKDDGPQRNVPASLPQPAKDADRQPGWLSRLTGGLAKSSTKITEGVSAIFTKKRLDQETLDELEELLITADLGVKAAERITDALAQDKFDKEISEQEVHEALAAEITASLAPLEKPLAVNPANRPHVILMIGVNGAGKTTTIGKLAQKFKDAGNSVMLAAGDTFRAAAIEQLTVWGERTGAPVIAREVGADAAGLAYDALSAARAAGTDVLMIDTAGRLQNKTALMDELAKVVRVIKKLDPSAPHDVVLVLDATVGQNAISQADAFLKIAGVTGLVMTKLDGAARGGVLVALADKFALPIHHIGVGEAVDDLQPFRAESFARALAGAGE